ncbi:protein SPEAR3-like [Zingiber officinale]|uniref:protein SPEAR3-like n=1 Tax=Zingiber officinale TaxID=94328 RepID=UPI001C4B0CE1|nr:protein SPEAR3-like [Zingiber officinale]
MRSYVGQSKKGKKSNSSAKQIRQPQRGLGVAQLEKIRLQNKMTDLRGQFAYPDSSSLSTPSSVFGAHPSFMIGFEGSTEITYGEHFSGAAKWSLNDSNSHPMLFINEQDNERNNMRQDQQLQLSIGSKGRDSDSALDLELKLSL